MIISSKKFFDLVKSSIFLNLLWIFSRSSESSEFGTSFDSDDSEINFIILSKWPAAGQGFKITKWPAVWYFSQILRNGRDPSNSDYLMSINNGQAIQKSCIDCRSNA